jgi:hypothetical protein
MNTTRKNIKGGAVNIFKYTPEEIYKVMNNYLAASYAIKKTGNKLRNIITVKTTDSYKTQSDNAKQFNKIISLYSAYLIRLKSDFLGIKPSPSSIPHLPHLPPSV